MNRLKDSFSKIKFPSLPGRLKGVGRTPLIVAGVTIVLMVVSFLGARSVLRCWTMTKLPGITTANCAAGSSGGLQDPTISVNEEGTPVALPPTPVAVPEMQLPAWDGASRVNILFIGLDYRDYIANEGPPRSDSMILFTIDKSDRSHVVL